MTKEKLGSEPAFPFSQKYSSSSENHLGISKRFYAACAAMQGMLSNPDWVKTANIPDDFDEYVTRVVSASFDFSDELLRQEKL